jgi:ubiquinone/menaquinone biosynthesis C-methylase UbiE
MQRASEAEVDRLQGVYRGYMRRVAGRWDSGNRGNAAILAELEQHVADVLAAGGLLPLGERTILDIGCGYGHFLRFLQSLGATPARLHGVDLLPERVERARLTSPELDIQVANAEQLPFTDGSVDLVLLFSVFTSILDERMRMAVAAETRRVLSRGGSILWYDFRFDNPRNPNVKGMRRADVARCFPGAAVELRTVTLLPPLARRLGRLTPALYPRLAALPFLRTHLIGLIQP